MTVPPNVLLLHYVHDMTIEETAAILKIGSGTVKSRLSYGLSCLRNTRRRIGSLAVGVVMVIVAGAAILSRLVSEAVVLMLWTGGLTLLVVSAILRATRLILKAIDTLANQKPWFRPALPNCAAGSRSRRASSGRRRMETTENKPITADSGNVHEEKGLNQPGVKL